MKSAKSGFSLIELIMTIVIIGIAFLGVPLIVNSMVNTANWLDNSKSIYHGVSKVQVIRSKFWDEGNEDAFRKYGRFFVLLTEESQNANNFGFTCGNDDQNRSGHYEGSGRRNCVDTDAVVIGQETGINDFNDIDDYNGDIENDDDEVESLYVVTTAVNYIDYASIIASGDNNISIPSDASAVAGGTSNIKEIIVRVTKNSDGTGEYRYYATNIGTPVPFTKINQ